MLVAALLIALTAGGLVLARQTKRAQALAHVRAGIDHFEQQRTADAEKEWREAVRVDPGEATAWELLAGWYSDSGRWREAVEALRRLSEITPDAPGLASKLAVAAYRSGDEAAANRYAAQALSRNPDDVPALTVATRILAETSEVKLYTEYLRRLVRLQPQNAESHTLLGEALNEQRRYPEAAVVLQEALRLNPDDPRALTGRAVAAVSLDPSPAGLRQARSDLERALRLAPLAPLPHYELGKVYTRLGNGKAAVTELERAAELMPDRPDVLFELAAVYQRFGDDRAAADARTRFTRVRAEVDRARRLELRCATEADAFDACLEGGSAFARLGNQRKASVLLHRAQALKPSDPRPGRGLDALRASASAGADRR